MHILLISFFALLVLAQESFSQSTKTANKSEIKTDSQKVLEILDSLCVQNTDDFSSIDRMSKVMGYKKIPSSMQDGDSAIYKNGGSSYYGDFEGLKFIIGYAKNGGCSVALKSLNADEFIKILTKNFKIKRLAPVKEGIQIQEFFTIEKESIYAGGVFSVTYGRPETRIESLSVSYLPYKTLLKIKSQNY